MRIVVTATHPWDTDDGHVLAPGESAEVEDSDRIRDAIAAGKVREDAAPEQHQPIQQQPAARPKSRGTTDKEAGL